MNLQSCGALRTVGELHHSPARLRCASAQTRHKPSDSVSPPTNAPSQTTLSALAAARASICNRIMGIAARAPTPALATQSAWQAYAAANKGSTTAQQAVQAAKRTCCPILPTAAPATACARAASSARRASAHAQQVRPVQGQCLGLRSNPNQRPTCVPHLLSRCRPVRVQRAVHPHEPVLPSRRGLHLWHRWGHA